MGTGNDAAKAAAQQNAQTQAAIQQSVNSINNAFNSPALQQQYQSYGRSLNKYYTNQVNNQQQVNARNLTFALARSGLTGGSAAADANTQLQKDYTQGLLQASQQAQGGEAALQNADINTKNALTSEAEAGDLTASNQSQIGQALSTNLNAASNYGNANSLGNLFAGTAQIYNNEETAAANRKAQGSPIGSLYGGGTNSQSVFA